MKKYLLMILLGALGGSLLSPFLLRSWILRQGTAFLPQESSLTPTPSLSLSPLTTSNFWQERSSQAGLSLVAVQSFLNNQLLRSGTGIVLSSDGLIVTSADVVPSMTAVYQVFYGGHAARAVLVSRNSAKNIALLKVSLPDLNFIVAELGQDIRYVSGEEIIVSGKFIHLTEVTSFTQRGLINYASRDGVVVVDTPANLFVSGAAVVNGSGKIIGMTYFRGSQVFMTPAGVINDVLQQYLSTNAEVPKVQ